MLVGVGLDGDEEGATGGYRIVERVGIEDLEPLSMDRSVSPGVEIDEARRRRDRADPVLLEREYNRSDAGGRRSIAHHFHC